MLKYFAFLALLAVSLRRCVALQRRDAWTRTYQPNRDILLVVIYLPHHIGRCFLVVLYLSYYRKNVHIINHFTMFNEFGPNWDVYQVP